jgi:hypothetical protein
VYYGLPVLFVLSVGPLLTALLLTALAGPLRLLLLLLVIFLAALLSALLTALLVLLIGVVHYLSPWGMFSLRNNL